MSNSSPNQNEVNVQRLKQDVSAIGLPASSQRVFVRTLKQLFEKLISHETLEEAEEALNDEFAGVTAILHSNDYCEKCVNSLYALLSLPGLSNGQIQNIFALLQEQELLREEEIDFTKLQQRLDEEYDIALDDSQEDEAEADKEELDDQAKIYEQENAAAAEDLADSMMNTREGDINNQPEGAETKAETESLKEKKEASPGYSDSLFADISKAEVTIALNVPEFTDLIDTARAQNRVALCLWNFAHGEGTPQPYYPGLQEKSARTVFKAHFDTEEPTQAQIEMKVMDDALAALGVHLTYPTPIISNDPKKAVLYTAIRLSGNPEASPTNTPVEWKKSQELVGYFLPESESQLRLENLLDARKRLYFGINRIRDFQNAKANGKNISLSTSQRIELATALGTDPSTVQSAVNSKNFDALHERAHQLNQTYTHIACSLLIRGNPAAMEQIADCFESGNPQLANALIGNALGHVVPAAGAGALASAHLSTKVALSGAPSILTTPQIDIAAGGGAAPAA